LYLVSPKSVTVDWRKIGLAPIIESRRHKKEPQAEYALGVGRSLLPHT